MRLRLLFITLLTVLLLVQNTTYGQNKTQNSLDYEIGKNLEIFSNLFRDANLFYVDSTNPGTMIKSAANAMLGKLDPYTEYIPASERDDFEFMTTGKYGGIGALIRQRGEWVEISEPYQDSPSDRAGLKAGDRLIEINDSLLRGMSTQRVSNMLKGPAGTTLHIKIRPIEDTTTIRALEIKRQRIVVPGVPYSGMVNDSIGYISLNTFTEDCAAEVATAFEKLRKDPKLSGLILDLRNNGGGLVNEAVKLVSLFVPRSTKVVDIKGKIKETDKTYSTSSHPIDTKIPLAILINRSSASASEIVAGSLQDLDRAVVIGQRSFGKGLVQSTRNIGYNSMLKITTAKYYTPSGRCIQAIDYSHRNEDGSVGHVPDSLIKEFGTKLGRKVYDGGGINPDIKVDPEYYSKFTAILLASGYMDDFTNSYAAHSRIDPDNFSVDDSLYSHFLEFMKDKPIEFESATEQKLKEVKLWAEREKYLDRIKELLDTISEKIKDDKMAELRTFAPEIKEVMTSEIITRKAYSSASIKHSLKTDKEVRRAVEILENQSLYKQIVTTQDTEKR